MKFGWKKGIRGERERVSIGILFFLQVTGTESSAFARGVSII